MKCRLLFLALFCLFISINCFPQSFQEIATALPNLRGGEAAWGDYDNDGDLDVLITGSDQSYNRIAAVYQYLGSDLFEYKSGIILTGTAAGTADWIDYDNDGDLDIMITGQDNSNNFLCKIYKNNGGSSFTEVTLIALPGLGYSPSADWGDYNNDGDPDILLTGQDENYNKISKVFRNNGNETFTEQTGIALATGYSGNAVWADYNNDGKPDIFYTGLSNSQAVTKTYRNNGDNTFTEQTGISLTGAYNASLAFGDYDNDGDLDILLNGESNGQFSKIFKNNNDNTFTEQTGISLAAVSNGSVAWGDYDNDGDPDILITGQLQDNTCYSGLYKNNGNNTFTEQTGITLTGVSNGSAGFGDYDNDGDLDILLCGSNSSHNPVTRLYKNTGTTFNTKPAAPSGLSHSVSGNNATLSWNRSTDTQTPQAGLSYNLYISTFSQGSNIKSPHAIIPSGLRKIAEAGELINNSYVIRNLATGNYYWSVQAIDPVFAGSAFAAEGSFTITFSNSISPADDQYLAPGISGIPLTVSETETADSRQWKYSLVPGGPYNKVLTGQTSSSYTPVITQDSVMYVVCVSTKSTISITSNEVKIARFQFDEQTAIALPGISHGSMDWGDYDNDDDLDILITGVDQNSVRVTKVYSNNGNNTFTEQTGLSLTGVYRGSADWTDYDNDGDLDIMITGYNSSNVPVSEIYKNNGNKTFTEQTGIVLTGVYYSSTDWGDYDNDGDMDVIITGYNGSGLSKIYRNNGNNSFTEQSSITLTPVYYSDCSWADYDRDGDLDILITGYNAGSVSKIYRNNGDNTFSEQTGIILTGVYHSSVAWGDYNNDEFPDILLTGFNSVSGQQVSKVYKNNGNNSFTEQTSIRLSGVYLGSAEWGDYDNDGDLDILLSGSSAAGVVSEIYRNDGSNSFVKQKSSSFTGVYYSKLKWADYDNDKDLDILLSGYTGSARLTRIYRNISEHPNTPPGPPRSLEIEASGSEIKFKWESPTTQDETNARGLSYSLRIGVSPGSSGIKSANASPVSGKHTIVGHGNVGHIYSWTIKNLPAGSYYWSVQTIDHGYLASEFAAEQSFENYYRESGLTYTGEGPPYLGDYDKDGDLDILAGDGSISEIYRNDISAGSGFTDINAGLTTAYRMDGSSAWGDYDNDGDLDFAHMGYGGGGFFTLIFRNDNGSFSDINAGMQGAWMGRLSWIDYDNDGDLDLIIYGNHEFSDDGEPIGILYRNDGNDKFTDSGIEVEDARRGSVAIADYNGDGYYDILTCGFNLSQNLFTSVLKNNKDNTFTNIYAGIEGYSYGDLSWGDYDSDGDLDIFITGSDKSYNGSSNIYQNQGNGSFTDLGLDLPGGTSYHGMAEWGDYDNDGDLDVLLPAKNCLFRNEGNNKFTTVYLGISIYTGAWGDVDNDGDLDIVTGSAILLNNIPVANTAPSIPQGQQSKVAGNQVTMRWNRSDDDTTPSNGISYNVCVGTSPGVWDVLSPMVDASTGYRKLIPGMGNAMPDTFKIVKELPVGTYYWAVQAVDYGYMSSAFSPVQSFEIFPMFTVAYSPAGSFYNSRWGDYDNDGDLDFIEREYPKMSLYRNEGTDVFTNFSINITYDYMANEYFTWGDYDNDGDLDIITSDSIFRNDHNNIFTNTGIHFPDPLLNIITGDYDADGDLDILARISEDSKSIIYRNEKNNLFTLIELPFDPGYYGGLAWFDYDNDGDLDITIVTGDYESTSLQIYRNDDNDTFTNINADLTGLMYCSITFADYDNDNDLDIMMIGRDNNSDNRTKIYRNDGNDTFTDINVNIRGYYGYSDPPQAFWGDHNNDGYIDVIISGINNGRTRNKLYRNNKDESFTELDIENIVEYIDILDFGDYDNDGDLDAITRDGIFRNNTNPSNEIPHTITNLSSDLKGLNSLLSWNPSDDEKGKGYSYNIKIGTTPTSCNIKSPMSTPGFGNVPCDTSWLIRDLTPGLYYWSVQAINQTYSTGPWAPVKSFLITYVSPDFSATTACNGTTTVFTDLSVTSDVIIKWKWNFGDGDTSYQRNPVHKYLTAGTYNVSLWTYSQKGDSAERVRPVIVMPSPDASFSVTPVCKDQTSVLQNQSVVNDITITSWKWDFGNGEFSNLQNSVEKTYIRSDTAILTIKADNGCMDADTQIVVVAEYPSAILSLLPGYSNIFCSGDSTILNVPYSDKYNYRWKLNDADIFDAYGAVLTVRGPGGKYSVEVTNPVAACTSGANINITVNKAPARPSIDYGDYYSGKCLGGTPVILRVDDISPGYKYTWYRNGSPIGDSTFVEVFEEGNYYLEANLDNCTSDTASLTVEFMQSLQKPVIIARGPTVWYLATTSTAKYYRWYLNGIHLPLADNSKVYVAGQNLGIYRLSISDDNQCYAFSDTVRIPKSIVGIEDPDPVTDVKIYPNPTTGLVTIDMNNNLFGELAIDIISQNGSKIVNIKFEKTTEHFSGKIDLSGQSKGMYLVNLSLDKFRAVRKVMVE